MGQNRVIISCLTESLILLVHLCFLIHCNSRPFFAALLPTYMFLVCVCASDSFFSSLVFFMCMQSIKSFRVGFIYDFLSSFLISGFIHWDILVASKFLKYSILFIVQTVHRNEQ